ncbi:hypothetical protein SVI_3889 [Shewanella violacea DSS12]|uniref:Uncharacterized protein n=1 Tax=Shewanella violacea (strain JCM 10179 / CIP 106290 / LMG 19151 / DSS12) TaxID=637905 RepID=D4ZCW5_SHEVD|nr:hypothetical protein SVI_3889 [Shewanella violacea DSS12]
MNRINSLNLLMLLFLMVLVVIVSNLIISVIKSYALFISKSEFIINKVNELTPDMPPM